MKSNRIIWGFVALVVLATIAVTFGTLNSRGQEKSLVIAQPTSKPDNKGYEDFSEYSVTDYNAPLYENAEVREKRKLANQRYDNEGWVTSNPHPDTGMFGRFDEITPPPLIPVDESDLVISGKIIESSAHLSNDKRGVYTEFTLRIDQILKNNLSHKVSQGMTVIADRAGGFVLYPNGQKVLYKLSEHELPVVGGEYIFFLTCDGKSPNYEILIGYDVKDRSIRQLDPQRRFEEFKGTDKLRFMSDIRARISESLTKKAPMEKP